MARTIDEINQGMVTAIENDERLAGLTSTSKVAIWRLMVYVVAVAVWTLEKLFDLHKAEVDATVRDLKPHSLRWYRVKSLGFQYGYPLVTDSDVYDNTALTDEQVAVSRVIKYCAVGEASGEARLVVKIATEAGGELSPIAPEVLESFKHYMAEIKDAGVPITVINYLPDRLYLTITVYYDPLVLNADGTNIIDGTKPVDDAIKAYLKELPFNGTLVLAYLVDRLQAIPGVVIPHIASAASSWINPVLGDYGTITPINVYKVPESGYFTVVTFDNITYQPYV